jgi:hypothetical protein
MEDEMLEFWTAMLIVMVIAAIILFPISMAFGGLLTREPPRLDDLIGVLWSSRRRTHQAAITMTANSSFTATSIISVPPFVPGTSASATVKYTGTGTEQLSPTNPLLTPTAGGTRAAA